MSDSIRWSEVRMECQTCWFFQPDSEGARTGTCRHESPRLGGVQFPGVDADEWCGKYAHAAGKHRTQIAVLPT